MNGFRRYSKLLLKEATQLGRSTDQHHYSKEGLEVWTNYLFNRPGPRSLSRNLSPAEEIFRHVFYSFIEVLESFERLRDFPIYLRQFQYSGSRITEACYFRYTVENYLNEMYILQERLLAYTKRLGRYIAKRDQGTQAWKILEQVENLVKSTLQPIISTRGAHVHESRYADEDLRRLATLELLIFHGGRGQLRGWYRAEMTRIRKKGRETIQTNNRQIKKMLDLYFETVRPFVFGPKVYLVGKRAGLQPPKEL